MDSQSFKDFLRIQNTINEEPNSPVKVFKKQKRCNIRLSNVKYEDTELDSPINIRRVSDVDSPIRKVNDVNNSPTLVKEEGKFSFFVGQPALAYRFSNDIKKFNRELIRTIC